MVGRINPVGAAIVMVFFGLLCVAVVFGSQALSYTTSVKVRRVLLNSGIIRTPMILWQESLFRIRRKNSNRRCVCVCSSSVSMMLIRIIIR